VSYVYIQSEPTLWTVGHYDPTGKWHPVSDHDSPGEAGERTRVLNGGTPAIDVDTVRHAKAWRDLCRRIGADEDVPVREMLEHVSYPTKSRKSVEQENWYRAGTLAAQAADAVLHINTYHEIGGAITHVVDALVLVINAIDNLAGTADPGCDA